MIEKILSRKEFVERPPVLLDIGASVGFYEAWSALAPYSICIAFDADTRDMAHASDTVHPYKTLFTHNSIATADEKSETAFFLTKAPVCSSTLELDKEELRHWAFSDMFEVEKKTLMKSENLNVILRKHNLTYVDWFKTDSQGTDLRLFKSLDKKVAEKILAADFEPGIIDAYKGEDKLWQVFAYMHELPFFTTNIKILDARRTSLETRKALHTGSALEAGTAGVPAWAEISYLRTLAEDRALDIREYLLLWVCAISKQQFGFAAEVALAGATRFGDPIFGELARDSVKRSEAVANYKKRSSTIARNLSAISKPIKKLLRRIL